MYNINEVSQVNKKYVFFQLSNGTQDKKVVNKRELEYLYNDVCENMKSYDFMKVECEKVGELTKDKHDKIEIEIKSYEEYIHNNQEDPTVRRGLHNVYFELENSKRKYHELTFQVSGINKTWSYASDKYWELYKLKKQIESVLKTI